MKKVLILFSGGLDSLLSAKLLKEQGYEVEGVHFQNPFSASSTEKIKEIAAQIPLKLHLIRLGDDYLRLIEKPKHGRGKRMNPCLDCRIFLLKKAWQLAKRLGFDFLATGEVLGQRPFSQRQEAMDLVEKEAGLKGKVLRPLIKLGLRGRSRKKQFELAKNYGLTKFLTPAGGCLLTDPGFSRKIKEFLDYGGKLSLSMIKFLKLGRHFRVDNKKVIIGRNEEENKKLEELAKKEDWWFGEVMDIPSPMGVVFDPPKADTFRRAGEVLKKASYLLAYYSDAQKDEEVICDWRRKGKRRKIPLLVPQRVSTRPL